MEWNNDIKIRITDDGRIFDENDKELFELTSQQQDVLCNQLYPNDPIIKDAYTLSRRSKSKRGISLEKLMEQYPSFNSFIPIINTEESMDEKTILSLGGERLLELVSSDFNFKNASDRLGIKKDTLRIWFNRWVKQTGISKDILVKPYTHIKDIHINENEKKYKQRYKRYIFDSHRRKIDFNIDYELFYCLVSSPCIYCGYIKEMNGIDRKNNSIGYIESNCVSCCKICNFSKRNISELDFYSWLERLVYPIKNPIVKLDVFKAKYKYGMYKYSSKSRKIDFDISFDIFSFIIIKPCYYCGIQGLNGIDRLDNTLGYTESNCVPCCKICNYAKRDLSLDDWNTWLYQLRKYRQ